MTVEEMLTRARAFDAVYRKGKRRVSKYKRRSPKENQAVVKLEMSEEEKQKLKIERKAAFLALKKTKEYYNEN